jgi:hypothetical protein
MSVRSLHTRCRTPGRYLRVSATQAGRNGLGVEAQREATQLFMAAEETGEGADALERGSALREALAQAKKAKAAVVVAKLDRLVVTWRLSPG